MPKPNKQQKHPYPNHIMYVQTDIFFIYQEPRPGTIYRLPSLCSSFTRYAKGGAFRPPRSPPKGDRSVSSFLTPELSTRLQVIDIIRAIAVPHGLAPCHVLISDIAPPES